MAKAVRNSTFTSSGGGTQASFTLPTCEVGDLLVVITGGGSRITSYPSGWSQLDYRTGQEAQGWAMYKTAAADDSGAARTLSYDGGDQRSIFSIAVVGAADRTPYLVQRSGVAGQTMSPTVTTGSVLAAEGDAIALLTFARNATTLPTSTLGPPAHSSLSGGSAGAAWIASAFADGYRQVQLSLPQRSGHYSFGVALHDPANRAPGYVYNNGTVSLPVVNVQENPAATTEFPATSIVGSSSDVLKYPGDGQYVRSTYTGIQGDPSSSSTAQFYAENHEDAWYGSLSATSPSGDRVPAGANVNTVRMKVTYGHHSVRFLQHDQIGVRVRASGSLLDSFLLTSGHEYPRGSTSTRESTRSHWVEWWDVAKNGLVGQGDGSSGIWINYRSELGGGPSPGSAEHGPPGDPCWLEVDSLAFEFDWSEYIYASTVVLVNTATEFSSTSPVTLIETEAEVIEGAFVMSRARFS